MAISAWTWNAYITSYNSTMPDEKLEQMTGAGYLQFYMEAFIDLYRNHRDILRLIIASTVICGMRRPRWSSGRRS